MYSTIFDIRSGQAYSIFSTFGKNLIKKYVKNFVQKGGATSEDKWQYKSQHGSTSKFPSQYACENHVKNVSCRNKLNPKACIAKKITQCTLTDYGRKFETLRPFQDFKNYCKFRPDGDHGVEITRKRITEIEELFKSLTDYKPQARALIEEGLTSLSPSFFLEEWNLKASRHLRGTIWRYDTRFIKAAQEEFKQIQNKIQNEKCKRGIEFATRQKKIQGLESKLETLNGNVLETRKKILGLQSAITPLYKQHNESTTGAKIEQRRQLQAEIEQRQQIITEEENKEQQLQAEIIKSQQQITEEKNKVQTLRADENDPSFALGNKSGEILQKLNAILEDEKVMSEIKETQTTIRNLEDKLKATKGDVQRSQLQTQIDSHNVKLETLINQLHVLNQTRGSD